MDIDWEYLGDLLLLSDCSEPVLPLEGWSFAGSDRGAWGEKRRAAMPVHARAMSVHLTRIHNQMKVWNGVLCNFGGLVYYLNLAIREPTGSN